MEYKFIKEFQKKKKKTEFQSHYDCLRRLKRIYCFCSVYFFSPSLRVLKKKKEKNRYEKIE